MAPTPTPLTASDKPVAETTKTPEVEAAVEELKREAFAETTEAPKVPETPKAQETLKAEGPVPYVRKADRPAEEPKPEFTVGVPVASRRLWMSSEGRSLLEAPR